MFYKIIRRLLLSVSFCAPTLFFANAQTIPFFKDAIKENRDKFYADVSKSIISSLSEPLIEENEADWINAFSSINLLQYRTPFVDAKIKFAAGHMPGRSSDYKKALVELLNAFYPGYTTQVRNLFINPDDDPLLMVMAANYILKDKVPSDIILIKKKLLQKIKTDPANVVLAELWHWVTDKKIQIPPIDGFFPPAYLPGSVVVLSFQRRDRNYPGLVIVRDTAGHFIKNADSTFFSVHQLARSESNMPGYVSMGNTPQGIFRMDGFDTSKNFFIGPVTNIQLTMPFEFKASHFYRDNTLNDSVWTETQYAKLLPDAFKNYRPIFGTYYAGKAGRNEIIAHGTTIDPAYYLHTAYYPYTPSAGCLVTKEFWNEQTGYLQSSDQMLLTEAVKRAGGLQGYLIVIELNDDKAPVMLRDIILMMH